ncbi:hypothetical protein TL16_g02352 [Triparma laevis f. inornata]|uniref:Glycosyl transferase family 1 domain-containing protein n=1 Tax=Triparma laevis f. inornata TaxID=1714386 RepID=A0A9W7DW93_9STRA|nr:hypothetical protein TL16_g02352 [Triparma laevis f. inornata]
MCVCVSSELQEKRADWRLDSRDAEVFPYKKSTDGEEADCFPVSIQAGEEDMRSVIFMGGGAPSVDKTARGFEWGNCHTNFQEIKKGSTEASRIETKVECLEDAYYSDTSMNSPPFVGIEFPVGGGFGWGTVGQELARWMIGNGDGMEKPLFFEEVHGGTLEVELRNSLQDWAVWSSEMKATHIPNQRNRTQWLVKPTNPENATDGRKAECKVVDFPVFHALGKFGDDDFVDSYNFLFDEATTNSSVPTVSRNNIGIIFSESVVWAKEDIQRLRYYQTLLAGSTWNAKVIREASKQLFPEHPPLEVGVFLQGVNKDIWGTEEVCAAPGNDDEFVIFSGGKLEMRKGQDIVIAAFKVRRSDRRRSEATIKRVTEFSKTHPDARLMIAWENDWPASLETMNNSTLVSGVPGYDSNKGGYDMVGWLELNGIERGKVKDLGRQDQAAMAVELAKADVGVFTNRCEGGTNLVAMETIASNVPVILSSNTGHKDVIKKVCNGSRGTKKKKKPPFGGPGLGCYALKNQEESSLRSGWSESSVEEVVEMLEKVYNEREEAKEVARRGKARIWSWEDEFNKIFGRIRSQYRSPPNRG